MFGTFVALTDERTAFAVVKAIVRVARSRWTATVAETGCLQPTEDGSFPRTEETDNQTDETSQPVPRPILSTVLLDPALPVFMPRTVALTLPVWGMLVFNALLNNTRS